MSFQSANDYADEKASCSSSFGKNGKRLQVVDKETDRSARGLDFYRGNVVCSPFPETSRPPEQTDAKLQRGLFFSSSNFFEIFSTFEGETR